MYTSTPHETVWVTLEPGRTETRVLASVAGRGTVLKARLPVWPASPGAVPLLLEALCGWYGQPLHAVIDADAEDVRRNPQRWAKALGEPPAHVRVDWVSVPPRRPDRFLGELGRFDGAKRLMSFTATGRR